MSEVPQKPQQQAQGTGEPAEEQGNEDSYSYSDSSTETHTEDKTPKGLLAPLLNLDILPSPESNTTTMDSSDSESSEGSEENKEAEGGPSVNQSGTMRVSVEAAAHPTKLPLQR